MPPRNRHPLYPEPGAWVLDRHQQLPTIDPPEPLPSGDSVLEAGTIRDDYVAYEGLGFCLYSYIPPAKIRDPRLRKLWQKARQSMQAVVEYLETAPEARGYRREFKQRKRPVKRRPRKAQQVVESPDVQEEEIDLADIGDSILD